MRRSDSERAVHQYIEGPANAAFMAVRSRREGSEEIMYSSRLWVNIFLDIIVSDQIRVCEGGPDQERSPDLLFFSRFIRLYSYSSITVAK